MACKDIPYDLLKKYDRAVPRYTSFPTTVHFSHDISQAYYAHLISSPAAEDHVSLYIHIPFCRHLCHYCGCHTKAVNNYNPVQAYLLYLHKEIQKVGETLAHKPHVSSLHFGGGTPNMLKSGDMETLIEKLKTYFHFDETTDIDIELDPRLLEIENIKALADVGVSRVSLGVQDFNPDVQNAVNRIQPFEKIQDDVLALRESGIRNINFDLMIGLPLQTAENVTLNAERAMSLLPDRMAVFAYAHVPWMKKHQKLLEKYELPDTAARYEMNTIMQNVFTGAGYDSIGIDHYAHRLDPLFRAKENGALHRNFQGYTADETQTIIGFGISAISSFKGAYIQNTTDSKTYREALQDNRFPVQRGRILTGEDIVRRGLIEKLMCSFDLDMNDLGDIRYDSGGLNELEQDEIIRFDHGRLRVTGRGKPFTRIVASCFDPYFQQEENRHAKAV